MNERREQHPLPHYYESGNSSQWSSWKSAGSLMEVSRFLIASFKVRSAKHKTQTPHRIAPRPPPSSPRLLHRRPPPPSPSRRHSLCRVFAAAFVAFEQPPYVLFRLCLCESRDDGRRCWREEEEEEDEEEEGETRAMMITIGGVGGRRASPPPSAIARREGGCSIGG
jgi:hypothetical protein